MIVRLIQYHWNLWFRSQNFLLITGLGVLTGVNSGLSLLSLGDPLTHKLSFWDGVLMSFMGPSFQYFSFSEAIGWLVIPLVFLYLVALIPAEYELYFAVMRSGSRFRWFLSQAATIVIISLIFTAGLFVGILVGTLSVLPYGTSANALLEYLDVFNLSTHSAILWGVVLTLSTLCLLGIVQLLLCALSGRRIYSYIILTGVCIGSIIFDGIAVWLPGTQMILRQHSPFSSTLPFFTFTFSLAYNGIGLFVLMFIGQQLSQRYDFIRSES